MNDQQFGDLSVLSEAPSRIAGHGPIAIIDIGSNSVRLVVYERLARSPTVLFNEKALCGLGRGLQQTGFLSEEGIESALAAIHRFNAVAERLRCVELYVVATAAAREAENGLDFIEQVAEIVRLEPIILSGPEEAKYSAYGVRSGIYRPNGIIGDMGGGSLEFAHIKLDEIGAAESHPFGGLRLQELSKNNPVKALKLVQAVLADSPALKQGWRRNFYAIGGTWRSLAMLYLHQQDYPLHVLHNYVIPTKKMAAFCAEVIKTPLEKIKYFEEVSKNRRSLLAYGAAVLAAIIEVMKPANIVVSALGVREGFLYELLDEREREKDGLLAGAEELCLLRSRSPANNWELFEWTKALMGVLGFEENEEQQRLREAACLLSDLGWRAHPDYRGDHSLNTIAHADFVTIDHAGRAFVALSAYFRHAGQVDDATLPTIGKLVDDEMQLRARILGLGFRIAYLLSASTPGLITHCSFRRDEETLVLVIDETQADYVGERLIRRLQQIGKLMGMTTELQMEVVD